MNSLSQVARVTLSIFVWVIAVSSLIFSVLLGAIGNWQWSAFFISLIPLLISYLDSQRDESILGAKNGGAFHYFTLIANTLCIAILLLLTLLAAVGVLYIDSAPWTSETNFASWYMTGGIFITYFLIQPTEPNDDIPDLQRMEQMNRYSTRVGVAVAAIFTVLCLVVPLTSFMTAGYDPVALAVALFLTPGFLRIVREGLFYLQGTRLEEGSEGYRILRAVCIGVAGLAACIALGYVGYSLVRLELLPALFFAASVAMNAWSVKKYVTVGISIPEDEEDPEAEPAAS